MNASPVIAQLERINEVQRTNQDPWAKGPAMGDLAAGSRVSADAGLDDSFASCAASRNNCGLGQQPRVDGVK